MNKTIGFFGWLWVLAWPATAQEEGEPLNLEALLKPEVALATKQAQVMGEAPAVVDVIPRSELLRRGYRSVAEALRFLPGIQVHDDSLIPNVSLRGLHNGQRAWSRMLKVMIDGQAVPFLPEATNWLGPELIPLSAVERIEVIRGPGSALYGADAFLGVINVVSRRGEQVAGTYLTGTVGHGLGHPQAEASLITGFPTWWNTDWLAAAQWSQFDRSGQIPASTSPGLSLLEEAVTRQDTSAPQSLFVRASAQDTPLGQWRADVLFQHLDTSGEFYDTRPLTHATRLVADNRFFRGEWRQHWDSHWSSSLALAHAQAGPASGDRVSLGRTDYDLTRRFQSLSWEAAFDSAFRLDEQDFVSLGTDLNVTDQELPTYFRLYAPSQLRAGELELVGEPGDSHRFLNWGMYGQGVFHPWETTSLTLGLRHDWHNVYGGVWNARAALVSLWAEQLSAKLMYGSSFKAPSPQQLFGRPLVFGDILGNPALKPERAQTLEVALGTTPQTGWSFQANAYLTHVADAIRFVNQSGNPRATNADPIITGGVETSARFQQEDWLWEGNLAWQHASSDESFPSVTANLAAGMPLNPLPVTAYAEFRFSGPMPSTQSNYAANGHEPYALPPAAVVDLTLASRDLGLFGGETWLTVKLENLFDTPYAYPGFGGLDYPGRSRHIWLSVTQGF